MKKAALGFVLLFGSLFLVFASHVFAQDTEVEGRGRDKGDRKAKKAERVERRKEKKAERKAKRTEKRKARKGIGAANKGKSNRVHLMNAEVTGVSGSAFTVSKDGVSYAVTTDTSTKFRRHFWGESTLAEIAVGNAVSIWGIWSDDARTTILAKMVRNLSVQKRKGTFFGTVTSLTAGGFVMQSKIRGDQTVTVGPARIVNRREQPITLGDIAIGHRVRVKGVWDKSQNTVTSATHVKDFSLPPPVSPPVSPSATPTDSASPAQ